MGKLLERGGMYRSRILLKVDEMMVLVVLVMTMVMMVVMVV